MLVNFKLNQYFKSREDFHQLHEENREEHKSIYLYSCRYTCSRPQNSYSDDMYRGVFFGIKLYIIFIEVLLSVKKNAYIEKFSDQRNRSSYSHFYPKCLTKLK